MVGGALTRVLSVWVSVGRPSPVGLGVGGSVVASGSDTRPSHSCGVCVCDLGVVVTSSIFGLICYVGPGLSFRYFRLLF